MRVSCFGHSSTYKLLFRSLWLCLREQSNKSVVSFEKFCNRSFLQCQREKYKIAVCKYFEKAISKSSK